MITWDVDQPSDQSTSSMNICFPLHHREQDYSDLQVRKHLGAALRKVRDA